MLNEVSIELNTSTKGMLDNPSVRSLYPSGDVKYIVSFSDWDYTPAIGDTAFYCYVRGNNKVQRLLLSTNDPTQIDYDGDSIVINMPAVSVNAGDSERVELWGYDAALEEDNGWVLIAAWTQYFNKKAVF